MRINNAFNMLGSVYEDWQNALANPRYIRQRNTISWIDNTPMILPEPVKVDDVIKMAETGQYSFQVIDGSLIQIYYEFDNYGRSIRNARLAYYSAPASENELLEIVTDIEDESYMQPVYEQAEFPFVKWLRFDFAPETARGVLHHDCHLHISGFPDSRLMVRGIPTPKQFIEFIMAFCYKDIYQQYRLDEQGAYNDLQTIREINTPTITVEDSEIYQHIVCINIPSRQRAV
jgi:hypothetical protein